MVRNVRVDACRESLQPATEPPPDVIIERTAGRGAVVEPPHREIAFELVRTKMPGQLATRLEVAAADLRRVVFGHGVAERIPAGFLVLRQDVRHTKGVTSDLGAIRRRAGALERRTGHNQTESHDQRRARRAGHRCSRIAVVFRLGSDNAGRTLRLREGYGGPPKRTARRRLRSAPAGRKKAVAASSMVHSDSRSSSSSPETRPCTRTSGSADSPAAAA